MKESKENTPFDLEEFIDGGEAMEEAIKLYGQIDSGAASQYNIILGRGDVDNFLKLCLDGLADGGVFRNLKGELVSDAHVSHLMVLVDRDSRPIKGYSIFRVSGAEVE